MNPFLRVAAAVGPDRALAAARSASTNAPMLKVVFPMIIDPFVAPSVVHVGWSEYIQVSP
jgi:hypothetical protein